jgi:large subunit ribosomal protein L18
MNNLQKKKGDKRLVRHLRVRAKISGTKERPRLSVSKSIKHIFAQLIDDENGKTLASVSDHILGKEKVGKRGRIVATPVKEKKEEQSKKIAIAYAVGKLIAAKAKEAGIESVVFDRGGYKYHGRIKAIAEGAREGGLKF